MRGVVRAIALTGAVALLIGFMPSGSMAVNVTNDTGEPTAPIAPQVPTPAVSIASVTPVIVSVRPGATQDSLSINYQPLNPELFGGAVPSVISYELSLDATTWWVCEQPSAENIAAMLATCNLTNLKPLRTYGVYLRAIETQTTSSGTLSITGTSEVAGPAIGTTEIPQRLDRDKPAKLPSPRAMVAASFNAASNSLGIDAARRSVGVGTLPKITFSRDISNTAAVERHLVVSAQIGRGVIRPVAGAWGWVSDRSAVFRPKDYWPGNAKIRIVSDLDRVVLGKSGPTFLIGSKQLNKTFQFNTAREFIAKVDGATKKMNVYIDGKKVHTFPVSLGKADWETRNGTKVVSTSKEPNKIYRSESLGLTAPEDQYELEAHWNTRLTPTGEFIHSAPWAYSRLGRYNGSHGCTNMYEQDAEWFYKNTIPGDIVYFTSTGGNTVEPWNGPGGLWNIPWSKWVKKSALVSGTNSVETDSNAGTGSLESAQPASA